MQRRWQTSSLADPARWIELLLPIMLFDLASISMVVIAFLTHFFRLLEAACDTVKVIFERCLVPLRQVKAGTAQAVLASHRRASRWPRLAGTYSLSVNCEFVSRNFFLSPAVR